MIKWNDYIYPGIEYQIPGFFFIFLSLISALVKNIFAVVTLLCCAQLNAQEIDSDLYSSLNSSSLSLFMKSIYTNMEIVTYRASKQFGLVEEHTATYKKGKINTDRINFNITYTEFYILEDRKKSMGKYELDSVYNIYRYERTDFDSRNLRTYTFYHYFIFDQHVVSKEKIRTKEYLGTGSVEQDTVVTKDSVIYKVEHSGNDIIQTDLTPGGSVTTYTIEGGKLLKKVSALTGFSEEDIYLYDAKGQLASIQNNLIGEEGQKISNITRIHYTTDGLINEVIFEDQNGEILEKKMFSYK